MLRIRRFEERNRRAGGRSPNQIRQKNRRRKPLSVLRQKGRSVQRTVLGFKRVCNGVQALIEWTIPMAAKQGRVSANHIAAVSLADGRTINISSKIDKKYEAGKPFLNVINCN